MTAWIGRLAFEQKDPAVDNPKHPQPDRLFQRVAVVQNQGAVEKQYIAVFKINELPEVVRLDVANIHQSDPGVSAEQQRRNAGAKRVAEQHQLPAALGVRIFHGNQRQRTGEEDFIGVLSHGTLHVVHRSGSVVLVIIHRAVPDGIVDEIVDGLGGQGEGRLSAVNAVEVPLQHRLFVILSQGDPHGLGQPLRHIGDPLLPPMGVGPVIVVPLQQV